jgi:hypothetical protein
MGILRNYVEEETKSGKHTKKRHISEEERIELATTRERAHKGLQ